MTLSKTQRALAYVADGLTPAQAAEQAGVAPSTLRVAIARAKGKEVCPCCRQVVRAGFEVSDVLAVQERKRLAEIVMSLRQETTNDELELILLQLANHLRTSAP